LSNDERRRVTNPEDLWKLEVLKEISPAYQRNLWASFLVKDWNHYDKHVRTPWINDDIYFLGNRLGHTPSRNEVIRDMREKHLAERALLFYVMSHPEKTTLKNNLGYARSLSVGAFLETLEEVSGRKYLDKFGFDKFDVDLDN